MAAHDSAIGPFVAPVFCEAIQTDANRVKHWCTLRTSHTRHVCTPSCEYAWETGKAGSKPSPKPSKA